MNPRKPVFDAVKARLPDVWNDYGHILAMDNLLDALGFPREDDEWLDLALPLVEQFEGYAERLPNGSVRAYPDPGTGGAPWTIGFGSTTDEHGQPIKPGTIWTRERAVSRFKAHLAEFGEKVDALVKSAPTSPRQKAAITSLAYNIGDEALRRSTLLRKHLEGDYAGAAKEFARWNKAGGRVLKGLIRRREAEAAMYREGTA